MEDERIEKPPRISNVIKQYKPCIYCGEVMEYENIIKKMCFECKQKIKESRNLLYRKKITKKEFKIFVKNFGLQKKEMI